MSLTIEHEKSSSIAEHEKNFSTIGVDDAWKVLWTTMKRSHMCDMEGPVVGHCDLEQAPDKAQWGVFSVSPNHGG